MLPGKRRRTRCRAHIPICLRNKAAPDYQCKHQRRSGKLWTPLCAQCATPASSIAPLNLEILVCPWLFPFQLLSVAGTSRVFTSLLYNFGRVTRQCFPERYRDGSEMVSFLGWFGSFFPNSITQVSEVPEPKSRQRGALSFATLSVLCLRLDFRRRISLRQP